MTKEKETLLYIEHILNKSYNPVILCSFGKDSMVMLYLIRKIKKDIPVLFFKEPFFPKKYSFANEVIMDWDLAIYDYPPALTDFIQNDDSIEIVNWYQAGNAFIYLPTGTYESNEQGFLCALKDLLNKPVIKNYTFKWDTLFVGHKSDDKDPIFGTITPSEKTLDIKGLLLALPLMDWSDSDIWDYTIKNNIPYNDRRYDKNNNFKEFKDKTYNNDYHPCCYKCLNNKEDLTVICPKTDTLVKNISLSDLQNNEKKQTFLSIMNYVKSY